MDESRSREATQDLIRRAIDGDSKAMRELVADLTPVIRAAVMSVLTRAPGRRQPHQELEDVSQSVLLALFADRGRALREWDPARGRELASFVTMLAHRETVSVLRSRRRSPWTEHPTLLEELDRNEVSRMGPESEAISRDMLSALAVAMREHLSPRGAEVFDLMFLQGLPVEEVCDVAGMTPDAVYAWKSRIAKKLRELFAALTRAPSSIPPPFDSDPRLDRPEVRPRAAAGRRGASKPVTGTITKITRVPPRSTRSPTGPIPVIPRRTAGRLSRRAAGSSSAPPPPSER